MSILILFENSTHHHTIDNLCNNLSKRGFIVSSFNVIYWRFKKWNGKTLPLWMILLSYLAVIPRLRGLINTFFREKAMERLAENYSIIDIHFFSPIYDRLIPELRRRSKKIKITIWGSDLYRVDSKRREEQRVIYHMVDIIQIETTQISNDFLKYFPEFESKIRIAHFGIIQLDIISRLVRKTSYNFYRRELKLPEEKIILTCGTNGSEGHQHLKMLDCIDGLSAEIKEKLFLVIPMTYGGSKSYIAKVHKKVKSMSLPYRLPDSYLSLKDLCQYRIISDITLTIQVSDALASAIQEHIYAGDILIAGDWLPYGVLNDNGVFYLTTSIELLSDTITNTVKDFDLLRIKCSRNSEKISQLSAWDNVIKGWTDIYNEININSENETTFYHSTNLQCRTIY